MRVKSGFTLVEILIVMVILGILAAIVIPQFTNASEQAKESSLVSDLQTMRSQIELFKVHHNGLVPGAGGGTTPEQALTGLTDSTGATAAAPGAGVYGPYVQKLPLNPFTNGRGINGACAADGSAQGWKLDVVPTSPQYGYFTASDANHENL